MNILKCIVIAIVQYGIIELKVFIRFCIYILVNVVDIHNLEKIYVNTLQFIKTNLLILIEH